MNSLGIYFGLKDINVVEANGKKIINNIRLARASISSGELEEKVPAEIKLIAMLKDTFRTYRVNAQEAVFCILGQDLIVRTFDMPLLPQNELRGAINFEAKKYIPFKLEDLVYDFQVTYDKKSKSSLVLFVGIKKDILDSYVSIAGQLGLKINSLEYSAFSILRFLKLAGFSESGVSACLCFDLTNDDEVNFTVYEDGLPLFTRDIILASGPAGFEQDAQVDLSEKQEKLKTEIRASLDYYGRKFTDKDIANIYILGDAESSKNLESFFAETTVPVKLVDTQKALGRYTPYSSILAKSFSAALFKLSRLKLKINLIAAKPKISKPESLSLQPFSFLEGLKLDLRFLILAVIICVLAFGYGLTRLRPAQEELANIKNKRAAVASISGSESYDALEALDLKYKKSLSAMDKLVKTRMYATHPLDIIPRCLPEGVWLTSFSLRKKTEQSRELILSGQVYLGDSAKEFAAVNDFLSNLKKDLVFSKYFEEISIDSIDRAPLFDKSVSVFSISCKNYAERK